MSIFKFLVPFQSLEGPCSEAVGGIYLIRKKKQSIFSKCFINKTETPKYTNFYIHVYRLYIAWVWLFAEAIKRAIYTRFHSVYDKIAINFIN